MKSSKMPNAKGSSKGHGAGPTPPQHQGGGGISKSNEMRSDTAKQVSNKHPYPKGLS